MYKEEQITVSKEVIARLILEAFNSGRWSGGWEIARKYSLICHWEDIPQSENMDFKDALEDAIESMERKIANETTVV